MGGPIVDTWGFRALVAIDMVLLLAVALALTFGYRDTYQTPSRERILRLAFGSIGIIMRSARLRTLFPALFLLFSGWMLAFTYLPLAVTTLYHGPDRGRAIGLVLGMGGLATLILTPLLGALGDRFGHWRILFTASAAATILWPLPALAPDIISFTALWAVLTGVVSATFALSFNVLSSSVGDQARGRIMSLSFLPANTGLAIGPAIGSVVTRYSIFAVFPTAAVISALGLLVLFAAYRAPPASLETRLPV
jgi:predicted MFS family arabinose efflux permease